MTLESKMMLENVSGNLQNVYQQFQPDTMLHIDELTYRRRTSPELRNLWFYPADGHLYTIDEEGRVMWGITRRPQNLVLTHINEAYAQLTANGSSIPNYIPNTEEAIDCFKHDDTTHIDLNELKLKPICGRESGYFVVDPKRNLEEERNLERRRAMMRIFGPDEQNYCKNMEMFAEAGINPYIFALMAGYVKHRLRQNSARNGQYLARASCLGNFRYSSNFDAGWNNVSDKSIYICGVLASDSKQEASAGLSAQKNGKNGSSLNHDLTQKIAGRVAKVSPKLKSI